VMFVVHGEQGDQRTRINQNVSHASGP